MDTDNEYDDDDNLDNYGTPDGDYEDPDEDRDPYEDDYGEEPAEDDGQYIDTGFEGRIFDDTDRNNLRIGIARPVGIDDDLATGGNEEFKHLENMMKTPEDIFKTISFNTVKKYNLNEELYNDSIRIMQLINLHTKKLKYINPSCIVFSLLLFDRDVKTDKEIKKKLEDIYSKYSSDENITKIDIIRYYRFIKKLNKL